jgi:hypothetical protein
LQRTAPIGKEELAIKNGNTLENNCGDDVVEMPAKLATVEQPTVKNDKGGEERAKKGGGYRRQQREDPYVFITKADDEVWMQLKFVFIYLFCKTFKSECAPLRLNIRYHHHQYKMFVPYHYFVNVCYRLLSTSDASIVCRCVRFQLVQMQLYPTCVLCHTFE